MALISLERLFGSSLRRSMAKDSISEGVKTLPTVMVDLSNDEGGYINL